MEKLEDLAKYVNNAFKESTKIEDKAFIYFACFPGPGHKDSLGLFAGDTEEIRNEETLNHRLV